MIYNHARAAISRLPPIIRKGKIMKILSPALLLMASVAFVMLGCSDKSGPVEVPTDQALSSQTSSGSLAKGGMVVHSATGSGHVITGIGTRGGATWFFTFSALQHADGSFGGRVNINDHSFHAVGNYPVVYLNVQGNRALIVDYGEWPASWGGGFYYMAYVVTDNGEGSNAPPDQHSWGIALSASNPNEQPYISRLLSTTPEGFFAIGGELGWGTEQENTLTIDMGNTQVR
jgi:hypothetical protein